MLGDVNNWTSYFIAIFLAHIIVHTHIYIQYIYLHATTYELIQYRETYVCSTFLIPNNKQSMHTIFSTSNLVKDVHCTPTIACFRPSHYLLPPPYFLFYHRTHNYRNISILRHNTFRKCQSCQCTCSQSKCGVIHS